ncbi:hypothetical protein DXG01_014073 [Tephrocybe rancida]|nr:hypothetical protein DXG01_014073 [Tephrocybe rancida]
MRPGLDSLDITDMEQRDQFENEDGYDAADSGIQDPGDLPGKWELRRRADLAKMISDMARLGWDQPMMGQTFPVPSNQTPFISSESAHHWKSVLNEQRNAVIKSRQHNIPPSSAKSFPNVTVDEPGKVDIVNRAFLEAKHQNVEWEPVIQDISTDFCLNEEQMRAFRIVANHAASTSPDQLKMYMGGMGGTGKTQVLKALVKYFEAWGESHRLVVVAPTGTAASLLGGSTYHSMFGINDMVLFPRIRWHRLRADSSE